MRTEIVYLIHSFESFGFVPEAFVIKFDNANKAGVDSVRITKANLSKYSEFIDERDKLLVEICFKLEKAELLSLVNEPRIKSWEAFYDSFFKKRNASIKTIGVRNYITDYICEKQNLFFEKLNDKKLFLNKGRFPFNWPRLKIVEELPEVFYYFDYIGNQLQYALKSFVGDRELNLLNAKLISRKQARILIDNKIYEFESGVDGAKLIPFFTKHFILVEEKHIKEYIEKIVLPLVKSDKIIPTGFEINLLDKITTVQLKVREVSQQSQMSLFGFDENSGSDVVFDLMFYYDDFKFLSGRLGREVNYSTENGFVIENVIRDYDAENYYIENLKRLGINLEAGSQRMSHYSGLEWVSQNHEEISSLGVEIVYKNKKQDSEKLFVGERSIDLILDENKDWFDIKAKVKFGDYVVPFLQILNLIQKGVTSFFLPNGELAQIPKSWLQEYVTIFKFVKTIDGKPIVGKHLLRVAEEIEKNKGLKINVKEKLRKFFNMQAPEKYPLPDNFKANMREYQSYGYNWLRTVDEIKLGVCLADDMGLGKTIQTLALIQWLVNEGRGQTLIVVPTSLIHNWISEINKFCSDIRVLNHTGLNRAESSIAFNGYHVILTTYAILRRDKHIFTELLFDYCILDESQYIKNPKSDTAKTCYDLSANHYLCLSGTPLENSISDLWSQMNFLNKGMLGDHNHFLKSFKQEGNADLYHKLVRPFLLRRKKREVLKDLPEKTILIESADMPTDQHLFYRELRNRYRDLFVEDIENHRKINPIVLLKGLMKLRQAANHPVLVDSDYNSDSGKYNSVCLKINEIVAKKSKVLIYSSFVEHLKLYKTFLDTNEIKYCYLDGSTKDRQSQTEIFQTDPNYHVFLLSLKAGGTGLNLTAAEYVFMLDPWWNPAAENQAFDRAHRIGQTKNVFVYKFITKNSIEEKILSLQNEKTELFEKMIENNNSIADISVDQLMALIAD
jgi:superfamily II DNA or RNA helicase